MTRTAGTLKDRDLPKEGILNHILAPRSEILNAGSLVPAVTTVMIVTMFVSVLIVASPPASATIVSAPYHTTFADTATSFRHADCGIAKEIKAPAFGKKNGEFKAIGVSRSPYCPNATSDNSASWDAKMALYYNFSFGPTSPHILNASWLFKFTEQWAVTPYRSCLLNYSAKMSTCYAQSSISIVMVPYLYDLSNGTWGNGVGFVTGSWITHLSFGAVQNISQRHCKGTLCSVSSSNGTYGALVGANRTTQVSNLSFNFGAMPINASDHFQLLVILDVGTHTSAFTSNAHGVGKSMAVAAINIGNLNRYAKLLSIDYQ